MLLNPRLQCAFDQRNSPLCYTKAENDALIFHFFHQLHTSMTHSGLLELSSTSYISGAALHLLPVGFRHWGHQQETGWWEQGRMGIPRLLFCWTWVGSGCICPLNALLGWPIPSAAVSVRLSRLFLLALSSTGWSLVTLQSLCGSLNPAPALQKFWLNFLQLLLESAIFFLKRNQTGSSFTNWLDMPWTLPAGRSPSQLYWSRVKRNQMNLWGEQKAEMLGQM